MLRSILRGGAVMALSALALLTVVASNALSAQPVQPQAPASPVVPTVGLVTPAYTIDLQLVADNLSVPVNVSHAGDGSGRLFVLEQDGYIRIIKNGALLSTPYLTLTSLVEYGGEQGLLGLEFDPDFESNGTFYVNYTTSTPAARGDTVIARYQVANAAADVAQVLKVTNLITIGQPESNHNGGDLHFGPNDNYLYIGMGDGGGSNDQHGTIGNGQDPTVLLGKMLRLNVRGVPTYTIPVSNPFTQTIGYRPEIWSLGWRNPWRFSFDRVTGDLYVGDVGQRCWEEIDYQPASSPGGENYGWRNEEGFRLFDPDNAANCSQPVSTLLTTTKPITAYNHNFGSAVTGGYVYRGQQYPWLRGVYFYGDTYSGRLWAIQQVSPGSWSGAEKLVTPYGLTAFGEDEQGEIYVTDYGDPNTPGSGSIYKISSASPINLSASSKSVSTNQAVSGATVTYTIVVRNTGVPFYDTVRVTDTVPAGLSYAAGSLAATSGAIDASGAPTLKWSGTLSTTPTSIITITYRALVTAGANQIVTNTATIDPALNPPLTRSATLTVLPSAPNLTGSTKQAAASTAHSNNVLTYTIVLRNSGNAFTHTVRVTDTVPAGLAYVSGSLTASHGTPSDSAAPTLKWNGVMSPTPVVTLTYVVTVATTSTMFISNTALIDPGYAPPFSRTASIAVNPYNLFLPVIWRNP